MKKAAIYIMRLGLSLIYAILKLMPTSPGKVLFLSRQSNTITLDFEMTQDELRRENPDIKIVTICHRLEGEGHGAISFARSTLRSMYHLATSSVCVLDAYWPAVSILNHKKSLTVIQMWHALGKIKQSGYQTLGKAAGRDAQIARLMKMHEGYDYIIAGGSAWNPFYCKSFNTTEEKLVNCGLPRIDYLLQTEAENKEAVLGAYPEFTEKKVVLYAPTFRKNIELRWQALASIAGRESEFVLVIKGHPNQRIELGELPQTAGIYTCPEFSSAEMLAACDYLVTDYSAIAIEGAVLNKPTYYFVYDYEEYRKKNGMNIDLFETMPGCVFRDAGKLIDNLRAGEYNYEALQNYRRRYLPENLGGSTKAICALIIQNLGKSKSK